MRKIVIFLLFILSFFVYTDVFADDYPDDIYDGNYSIDELLKNYNIVTFGKKEIDSSTYSSHKILKGDVYVGHIVGRFLRISRYGVPALIFAGVGQQMEWYE